MNISIRNAPDSLIRKLEQRARANKRSLDGEALSILETALNADRPKLDARQLSREVKKLGISSPSESTRMIREDRDR